MNCKQVKEELEIFNTLTKTKGYSIICEENGEKLVSPSRVMKELSLPYDEDFWSTYVAMKNSGYKIYPKKLERKIGVPRIGEYYFKDIPKYFKLDVSPETLKAKWRKKSVFGTTKGNCVDCYIETGKKLYSRDVKELEPYWNDKVLINGREFDVCTIYDSQVLDVIYNQIDSFFDSFPQLEVLHKEYVLGSCELGIGGRADALAYDHERNGLVIIDWKTDKEIPTSNKYDKYLGVLSHLDDCKFNKYSIQTSFYRYIIEHETNIPVVDMFVGWFNFENSDYQTIKTKYLRDELQSICAVQSEKSFISNE